MKQGGGNVGSGSAGGCSRFWVTFGCLVLSGFRRGLRKCSIDKVLGWARLDWQCIASDMSACEERGL